MSTTEEEVKQEEQEQEGEQEEQEQEGEQEGEQEEKREEGVSQRFSVEVHKSLLNKTRVCCSSCNSVIMGLCVLCYILLLWDVIYCYYGML